jgi:NAD(P)-dependent dehydrogenase (short-subunit alcohol dehydrogenase family)
MMGIGVEHFDLTGRKALVLSAETPAGQAIAAAYEEAGAHVVALNTPSAGDVGPAVRRTAADLGGLQIFASAPDRFLAKPVTVITPDEAAEVFLGNYAVQFYACQAAIEVMLRQAPGSAIVLVTHVLGERGLPNTSVYAAAHGAVHNLIRALRFPIIKRAGVPADVGGNAVWLAGTAVGDVTGQVFPVDGGLTQHL